jgi:hypothetical protein
MRSNVALRLTGQHPCELFVSSRFIVQKEKYQTEMKRSHTRFKLLVLGVAISMMIAHQGRAQSIAAPSVPANLKVETGNQAFFKAAATGTQNFICIGSAWTFIGPQATLFVTLPWFNGGTIRQQVATHFLTPNPAEVETNRPLWQSSMDSSIVWAKQVDLSNDPDYVQPNAIPWLLLASAGKQVGPTSGSFLSQTTFIQRINTSGGLKPTTACTDGERQFVPYTADYVFYRKAGNGN